MNECSARNPNICVDCEALTFDDSPSTLAGQTEAGSPEESASPIEQTKSGEAFLVSQFDAASNFSRLCNASTEFL